MAVDALYLSLYFWSTLKIKTMSNQIQHDERRRNNRAMAGIILIAAGALYLLNQLSFFFLPYWIFSWPMIMIVIGLAIGFRNNFRSGGWFFMVVIGGIFLLNYIPGVHAFYFWPVFLIAVGIRMLFFKDHHHCYGRWDRRHDWKRNDTADNVSI